MLRAMRRMRLVSLAALLVIAGSVPVSLTAVMHDGSDDALHGPLLVWHDESAHRIGGGTADTPVPQHCVVCHWLQSFQPVAESVGIVEPTADYQRLVQSAALADGRSADGALSARAPPAA